MGGPIRGPIPTRLTGTTTAGRAIGTNATGLAIGAAGTITARRRTGKHILMSSVVKGIGSLRICQLGELAMEDTAQSSGRDHHGTGLHRTTDCLTKPGVIRVGMSPTPSFDVTLSDMFDLDGLLAAS
ncbi:hypothetical protein PT974_04649 [Cladobotryum mycophilum]|uniref:Uncharacterized protein n=1 Tax=Cladobotryum mycophilum TaxID=491253 RepID=A0ABR0SVS7_9HYPO